MIFKENTVFLIQNSIFFPKSENYTCFRSILRFPEFLTNTDNMFSLPCLAEELKMSSSKCSDAKNSVRNQARNHLLLFSKKWWGLIFFLLFFLFSFFWTEGWSGPTPLLLLAKVSRLFLCISILLSMTLLIFYATVCRDSLLSLFPLFLRYSYQSEPLYRIQCWLWKKCCMSRVNTFFILAKGPCFPSV